MMTRQERAKQFMAFDAMKGLREALRDREERHSRTQRRILSEEESERLNRKISRLEVGMKVKVSYYKAFHDTVSVGWLNCVDNEYGFLIVDHERIYYEDIYSLRTLEFKSA